MGVFDGVVNIPIRRSYSVDIVNLPPDLTVDEAKRISKIILALAQPADTDEHLDVLTLKDIGPQDPVPLWAPWQVDVLEHVLWNREYWRPVRFEQLNDQFSRIANLTLALLPKFEAGSSLGEIPAELNQDLRIFGEFAQVIEACLLIRKSLVAASLLRTFDSSSHISMATALETTGIDHQSMTTEIERMVDARLLTTKEQNETIFYTRSF